DHLSSHRISLYPSPLGDGIRKKAAEIYGVPEDWIMIGNGSDEILNLIFRAFLGKGDVVMYLYPTYILYRTLALFQEAEYQEIPFTYDETLPMELIDRPAQLKVICNPNSPSGTFFPIPQMEKLLQVSDCPVVIDEAYVDFSRDNCLSLLKTYPNLLIPRSFSKSFSLAGMRIGILFAHPEIVHGLLKLKDSYNLSCLSQVAAMAALEDIDAMWENVRKIRETREWFTRAMRELSFTVRPSEANFVMVQKGGENMRLLYEALKSRQILVRFFPEWPDLLRISIGTDLEMKTLLNALYSITGA
ncbi:MAG: aminotransferase class I/II-fold pyridoxal phosphate-dependent enzyme, partial [Atribacterota bacterium]